MSTSDEIELDKDIVNELASTMDKFKIHHIYGKVCTTDAIFRETRNKLDRRIVQGAVCVDMECSTMTVLCKFRGVKYGQIFLRPDNLANEKMMKGFLLE